MVQTTVRLQTAYFALCNANFMLSHFYEFSTLMHAHLEFICVFRNACSYFNSAVSCKLLRIVSAVYKTGGSSGSFICKTLRVSD